ncbi:MAG TPA: putative glycoside hydrolase, partial [Clostridia bacterium]|nr:putative glycoside hydrolase [Clostridia bacterium]
DATSIAAKLKANGITPAARICCFRDNATPQVLTGAAVKYSGNHSYMWYDANKKFWLNPYSSEAQQYLISLAGEAVSMGYTQIYLDGLTFPDNGRPSVNAWFGSDTTATKEETLKSFVAAAKQAVNTAGGKVNVMMPSAASMGQGETITGQDQSIYSYDADGFCPNLCPTLLSALSKIGDQSVTNAEKNPGDTVTAAATYLAGESTGSQLSGTVPFIQAYSGAKTYGATEIFAQISALKSKGITSYILYNPDGQYDLSSLSVK